MIIDITFNCQSFNKHSKIRDVNKASSNLDSSDLVIPGDPIPLETGYIKGHGIYEKEGKLYASYCGVLKRVNKLLYVSPLKSRYISHSGDVVVGRVDELNNGKWFIEIGAGQKGQLSIHSINLPGSVHRKRLNEDYFEMRKYFVEGDILCCEVQRAQDDNIILQTRNSKYGNLENGCLVKVSPCFIQKQNKHIINLSIGVQVILGSNGYIWISEPSKQSTHDTLNFTLSQTQYVTVDINTRVKIARVRNCIIALASKFFHLNPEIISIAYSLSLKLSLSVTDLIKQEVIDSLIQSIYQQQSI